MQVTQHSSTFSLTNQSLCAFLVSIDEFSVAVHDCLISFQKQEQCCRSWDYSFNISWAFTSCHSSSDKSLVCFTLWIDNQLKSRFRNVPGIIRCYCHLSYTYFWSALSTFITHSATFLLLLGVKKLSQIKSSSFFRSQTSLTHLSQEPSHQSLTFHFSYYLTVVNIMP